MTRAEHNEIDQFGMTATTSKDLTSFMDVAWLQSHPLTDRTAMEYFSLSPFYDRACNNETLRMQRMYRGDLDTTSTTPTDDAWINEQLALMTGMEYIVHSSTPPSLFVIYMRHRMSKEKTALVSIYYIMNGVVYQSPHLSAVLSTRVKTAEAWTIKAMEYAQEWLEADFHSATYSIKKGDDNIVTGKVSQREDEESFERVTTQLLARLNKQR
jgi:hypothetical protein